jgi:choline dehydrogenase-like flavoprotein
LRVADTSILPDIPSLQTNVTTIVVAERTATNRSSGHRFCDSNQPHPRHKET